MIRARHSASLALISLPFYYQLLSSLPLFVIDIFLNLALIYFTDLAGEPIY